AAAVLGAADLAGRIAARRRSEASVVFDPTDEASRTAHGKLSEALEEYQEERRAALQREHAERELLEFVARPLALSEVELAGKGRKGAYSFAPMLGLLVVLMSLTGAFYPAVDLVAGEKERGTLETLLVAPVARREVVLGKFAAVWSVAVGTALLNLLVMGLTFSKLASMVGSGRIAFSLPTGALLAVTAILVPTAALFSAVALALSAFATSYKEGQHYLSPLFLVSLPLAMVGLLPNVEIGPALAFVPVANVVLLVRAMLLGGEAAGPALWATAATAVYAGVALAAAVAVFQRESVLFRTGAGRGYDPVSLRAERLGLPSAGQALLLFFAVFAGLFFLSGRPPESLGGAVRVFLVSQLVAVLAPSLLLARVWRLRFRPTFALRPFAPSLAPALVTAGVGAVVIAVGLQRSLIGEREAEGLERVVALLQGAPPWIALLLLAALPAICEELLCRGFLLSALRPRLGAARAVVVSAALFGLLHVDLYRLPATFLGGLLLGYVCLATGSVWASAV
ncbi:MAG: ABC transporter permease subunit/CPBP intramembrane protease, partial [Planctomycetota bacterium]